MDGQYKIFLKLKNIKCTFQKINLKPQKIFTQDSSKNQFLTSRWTCVEYARRFLVINCNITFGDIDMAASMFEKLPEAYDIQNPNEQI